MYSIHLNQLRFFSYHGLFEEERILGSYYEVDLSLALDSDERISSLDRSVDYVSLYKMVKERMAIPTDLLETLAADLADQIHTHFAHAHSITISIFKEKPPIEQMQGRVGVSYSREF